MQNRPRTFIGQSTRPVKPYVPWSVSPTPRVYVERGHHDTINRRMGSRPIYRIERF